MKRISLLIAFIILLSFCQDLSAGTAMDAEFILVGTCPDFRPFEFLSAEGRIVGFDMDLVKFIAQKLDRKIRLVELPFSDIFPSLNSGRIHLGAAGISVTPERAGKVAFSGIYYTIPDAVVIRSQDQDPVTCLEEISGKTGAVQQGTLQERFLLARGDIQVRSLATLDDILGEVLCGRAHFALVDSDMAEAYLSTDAEYRINLQVAFRTRLTGRGMAFALNRNDVGFAEVLNRAIGELRDEGVIDMLERKWIEK